MSYRYDPQKGFDEKKTDNDIGSWVFIGIMFMVFWPVGLFLLISKLTDETKKKPAQQRTKASGTYTSTTGQTAQQSAPKQDIKSAPKTAPKKKKVTATPQYGSRGSHMMTAIGIAVLALGLVGLSATVRDIGFYLEYADIWSFISELFFPTGLAAGGIALMLGGRGMKRRARRFAKYRTVVGARKAVSIAELASAADVRMARAERDLELMVEKGLWGPQAYVDNGQDMLFLTAEAAREYHEMRNVRAKPAPEVKTAPAAEKEDDHSFRISAIRRANDRIDDAALSAKIDRLEQVTGRIFRFIEANPASADKANTFLNYYLPTTQKLLDSYADFEEAGISGENLDKAKERIEQTMDSIIAGFEHQLDELYRETAMDIDSDIRVMETMLRRDTASVADDFGLGGSAVQTMPKE